VYRFFTFILFFYSLYFSPFLFSFSFSFLLTFFGSVPGAGKCFCSIFAGQGVQPVFPRVWKYIGKEGVFLCLVAWDIL